MPQSPSHLPSRMSLLDRAAIWLSTACVIHCVATVTLVAAVSTAGGMLGNPLIHEGGLVLAILIGALAFGRGMTQHRRALPAALGAGGLLLMAAALVAPHDAGHVGESVLTVVGVALLALGHRMNRPVAERLADA